MTRPTIISGGQTGVDRAALDVARDLGLPSCGFIPAGRWSEDGPLPQDYPGMVETRSANPGKRTRLNVRESDATLIITRGGCKGGTLLTADTARRLGKPLLVIDLDVMDREAAAAAIDDWLRAVAPERLNVAGPRASKDRAIYADARAILSSVLG